MSLKLSKLKQLSQRNKDLSFGYLRENESQSRSNYPQLIKYLVLFYANAEDQFDPNATHESLEINKNCLINTRMLSGGPVTHKDLISYLKGIMCNGVHIWKLKYKNEKRWGCESYAQLGVWKTTSGKPIVENVWIDDTNDNGICSGYMITMDGFQTNPQNIVRHEKHKAEIEVNGDIIEMILDLNKFTLTFKRSANDKVIAQFDNIEKTSYRAAVSLYAKEESWELISYQDIYV